MKSGLRNTESTSIHKVIKVLHSDKYLQSYSKAVRTEFELGKNKLQCGIHNPLDKRSSEDRVSLISENLPQLPGSYLDIGSQLGYFVFKISEKGFLSCGIEVNPISCTYSRSLAILNDIKNVSFLNFQLDFL